MEDDKQGFDATALKWFGTMENHGKECEKKVLFFKIKNKAFTSQHHIPLNINLQNSLRTITLSATA